MTASDDALATIGELSHRLTLTPNGLQDIAYITTLPFDDEVNEHVHVTVEGEGSDRRIRVHVSEFDSTAERGGHRIDNAEKMYSYYLETGEFLECPHERC